MSSSSDLLTRLNEALTERDVVRGFTLLDDAEQQIAALQPTDSCAVALLVCVAQWVSLGYRDNEYFAEVIHPFCGLDRRKLPFAAYALLRLAEAQGAFLAEDMTASIAIFDFVLQIEAGILSDELIGVALYWKGRAHRRLGQFDAAFESICKAEDLTQRLGRSKLLALTKFQKARLLFRAGHRKEAFRLLDEAEEGLRSTGDALTLGNIESARGRFIRRMGEYDVALAHFERAIVIYGDRFPNRPNIARALVNAAYVKRLIALDLKKRQRSGRARAVDHVRYLQICHDALELLQRAGDIYASLRHQAGTGSVLVNSGYIRLDTGDIDQAETEAMTAYSLGAEKQDLALLARARILQATIQNERAEEQLGEEAALAICAHKARTYAEEAIELARRTDNSQILAGAFLVRGFIAASDFFQDWQMAKQFAALAGEILGKDDLDHLSKQLGQLKATIMRATSVDETLRSWSEGVTGQKTFQQITEEFAELVIPKVWEKQDRKISRVAELLSISPKKVRRVLKNRGLIEHG